MNVNTFLDYYPGWVGGWSNIDNKANHYAAAGAGLSLAMYVFKLQL